MKINVKKNPFPILSPDNFEEYTSIRNPGAIQYNNETILLLTIRYKNNKSKLHIARSKDKENFKLDQTPFIDNDADSLSGVEDARISKIGEEYFITFTAFKGYINGTNVTRVGLAKTKDFKTYYDRRIILDKFDNNKNCVIFENNGKYYLIHRPFNSKLYPIKTPGAKMLISETTDFKEFKDLKEFLSPREKMWDGSRIGANTPPIKIKHEKYGECLFMIYHGADKRENIYSMGYVLLDINNPLKILERSETPLIFPELNWEKQGEVNNVVFGCGIIPLNKNTLRLYYAGADRYTGFADLILEDAEILE